MRCKNCGANYRSRELYCPYCKTPNPRGAHWQLQREAAETEYTQVHGEVHSTLRLRTANRLLTRILIIEAVLAVLFFVGLIALFLFEDTFGQIGTLFRKDEIAEELDVLYEEERFGELYHLLSETDLFGEEYYEYSQMSLLYYSYESFCEKRLLLFQEPDDVDEYTISRLISETHEVLQGEIMAYPDMTPNNAVHHAEYCEDVLAFAKTFLGMTEEELEIFEQDYITTDEEDALTETILKRRAWKK